jgi:hypothetical protein
VRKKNASRQEAKDEISKLVGRLQGLKRKLEGMCVCVCERVRERERERERKRESW